MESANESRGPWLAARLGLGLRLVTAFSRFTGRRLWLASGLVAAGAVIEGVGLGLVAPLVALLTSAPDTRVVSGMTGIAPLPGRSGPIAMIGLGLALIVAARAVVTVARERTLAELQLGFTAHLRRHAGRILAGGDWTALTGLDHAEVAGALGLGIERCGAAIQALGQLATSTAVTSAVAIVAVALSPGLALLALGVLALSTVVLAPALVRARARGDEVGPAWQAMFHAVGGFLGGLKLTLSHGRGDAFVAAFDEHTDQLTASRVRFVTARSLAGAGASLMIAAAAGFVLLAGAGAFHLSAPVLLAFLVLSARLSGPVLTAQRSLLEATADLGAYGDLLALESRFAVPATAARPEPLEPVGELRARIELHGVVFRHASGAGVGPLDLTLEAGDFLGLEGPSGAGKTTLADLIAGLVAPQAGEIRIGGARLSGPVRAAWREAIAYVGQDAFLFDESVRANLAWARPDAGDAAMWEALRLAEAARLVEALPRGLDTSLGERGVLVSGGERQRLALARAVLRRPVLLILDEALNAVDEATEDLVTARLAALRPRPTILMIAHRRIGLARCDRILRLEDGMWRADRSPRLAGVG